MIVYKRNTAKSTDGIELIDLQVVREDKSPQRETCILVSSNVFLISKILEVNYNQ